MSILTLTGHAFAIVKQINFENRCSIDFSGVLTEHAYELNAIKKNITREVYVYIPFYCLPLAYVSHFGLLYIELMYHFWNKKKSDLHEF